MKINLMDEFQMDLINMKLDEIVKIEEVPFKRVFGGFVHPRIGRVSFEELLNMTNEGEQYQILSIIKRVK